MAWFQEDFQKAYMPHKTYRLLSQMYYVVVDCLAYYVYFKAIQKKISLKKNRNNHWLIATHNAYYDLCVLRWCMLFGSETVEPTHFYHLMSKKYNLVKKIKSLQITPPTKAGIKDHILSSGKIKHSEFYKFRKKTLLYRNKCLIHREHDPKFIHDKWINLPLTRIILKTAFPLYKLIIQIAATFPNHNTHNNKFLFAGRIFKNKGELSQYYRETYLDG